MQICIIHIQLHAISINVQLIESEISITKQIAVSASRLYASDVGTELALIASKQLLPCARKLLFTVD